LVSDKHSHSTLSLKLYFISGSPARVDESGRDCTLAHVIMEYERNHPEITQLEQQKNELIAKKNGGLSGRDIGMYHRDMSIMKKKLTSIRKQMTQDILLKYRVFVSTCIGSSDALLEDIIMPLCIIDEATQIMEPEILVPLSRGVRHAVLVGDHHQLGCLVKHNQSSMNGSSLSLFQRLISSTLNNHMKYYLDTGPHVLRLQYRMHPNILGLCNNLYYSNVIKNGITANDRRNIINFADPLNLQFYSTTNSEQIVKGKIEGGHQSICNPHEVEIVNNLLIKSIHACGSKISIAIITFYRGQLGLFESMLLNLSDEVKREIETKELIITTKCVDGYQGQESDIVILSCVRSNGSGSIGFLKDWRRVNVAISRAKSHLFVIGDESTIRKSDNPCWLKLINYRNFDHFSRY